jgi:hypothetical protein
MPEAGIIVTGGRDADLSTVEFEYIAQHEQDTTSGKLQAAFLYNRPRTPGPVRCGQGHPSASRPECAPGVGRGRKSRESETATDDEVRAMEANDTGDRREQPRDRL